MGGGTRQVEGDACATGRRVVQGNAPAQIIYKPARDGQPESGAGLVAADKRARAVAEQCIGKAATAVSDADFDTVFTGLRG